MRYIKELEGLRGIMALWVVLGHSLASLPLLHRGISPSVYNSYAVDVFIMLSGFVIFFMIDSKEQNYLEYISQRFFRIFPIYLFVLVLSVCFIDFVRDVLQLVSNSPSTGRRLELINEYHNNSFYHILSHLTLLQGIIPDFLLKDSSYTIIGQAWSVSVEWQFYLLAPMLFYLQNNIFRNNNFIFSFIIVVILTLIGKYFSSGFLGNNLLNFSIGFVTYFFYKNLQGKLTIKQLKIIFFIISIFAFLTLKRDSIPLLIWLLTFYSTLLHYRTNKYNVVSRVLNSQIILTIGRISYSIYMIHMLVLIVILRVLSFYGLATPMSYFIVPFLTICISVFLSMFTYRFIENPFIRLGKKITSK